MAPQTSNRVETIYVAPGHAQCRVYALPYALRTGQRPDDILPQYQGDWAEIGLLNAQLRLVCTDPSYADLAQEIQGLMGGAYFEVQRSPPRPSRQESTAPVPLVRTG